MKISSIKLLLENCLSTFKRFPLALSFTIAATVTTIFLVEVNFNFYQKHEYLFLVNFLHICFIALPLFIGLKLVFERKELNNNIKLIINAVAIAILVLYYYLLPSNPPWSAFLKTTVIVMALHGFVAFAVFIRKNELNGFWQFNKILFLRFLTAALYSFVLYIGLALAMLAIDQLFGIKIDGDYYFELWLIIVGIFNTWFFLAGIPTNFDQLEAITDYPTALKIFIQYVMMPLVLVYLLILYVYAFKILFQWEWPVGWVSNLVLSFSVVGIFSFLMVSPIKNSLNNKWIQIFSKLFFWLLFPLIFLLFFAIYRRISEYGITESRYFVLILACWLAGISIYFLIDKFRNIKIIPISLAIIAMLSAIGPWSAFNISYNQQFNRLINQFEKNHILVKGKLKKVNAATVSFNDSKEISSIVEYVIDYHGYDCFKPMVNENLDSLLNDTLYANRASKIVELMGLHFIRSWEDEAYNKNFHYSTSKSNNNQVVRIKNYDYLVNHNWYSSADSASNYMLDSIKLSLKMNVKTNNILLNINQSQKFLFDLKPIVIKLYQKYQNEDTYSLNNNELDFIFEENDLLVKFQINSISGNYVSKDSITISDLNADIFVKIKE